MTNQQMLVDKIFNEFDRLEVSTNQDPSSGLMTEHQNLLVEGKPEIVVVKIYDDYIEGYYDAKKVLDKLKSVTSVNSVTKEYFEEIWEILREFEV
jgi:hypothetical protein